MLHGPLWLSRDKRIQAKFHGKTRRAYASTLAFEVPALPHRYLFRPMYRLHSTGLP